MSDDPALTTVNSTHQFDQAALQHYLADIYCFNTGKLVV